MLSQYLNPIKTTYFLFFSLLLLLASCKDDEVKFVAPEVDVKSEDIDGSTYSIDEPFYLEFNVTPKNGITVDKIQLSYIRYIDDDFGEVLKDDFIEIKSKEQFTQHFEFDFDEYSDNLESGDKLWLQAYLTYVGRKEETKIFDFVVNVE